MTETIRIVQGEHRHTWHIRYGKDLVLDVKIHIPLSYKTEMEIVVDAVGSFLTRLKLPVPDIAVEFTGKKQPDFEVEL